MMNSSQKTMGLPVPPKRRGACPSVIAPMQTGDGLLARLVPYKRFFTPQQIQKICALAETHGNGLMEVTLRGSLQVRGLSAQSAPGFAAGLAAAGIELRQTIAIDINPLAGLDRCELADARPLARAIGEALATADWANRLAAKTAVIIDGGGVVSLSRLMGDIRLQAVPQGESDGRAGWWLSVGGRQDEARPVGLARTDQAAQTAALTLLEILAAKGPQVRGKDLTDDDLAALSGLDGLTVALPDDRATDRPVDGVAPSSAWGALVGIHRTVSETFPMAAGFAPVFGFITAQNLAAFAAKAGELVGDDNYHAIVLAPGKHILVLLPDDAALADLNAFAARSGLISRADDPRLRLVTCAGAPACASAHISTHDLAAAIVAQCEDELARLARPAVAAPIHISGCAKGCANPGDAIIDILADATGCTIRQGNAVLAAQVPLEDVPRRTGGLLPARTGAKQ